ncbi:hypothetical protein [Echinicola vietnamensis]|uniref:Uncharacterized protein n=1 Tax=Echinicola vietnamensis (strain DSM 17526 / LMG 23754 / KMM 6221) TaxID=926556 RepID=L0G0Z4_ECHVK|nr:hypothetical protein [Echinicola vietnamensis]AGA78973.1 hypothetical protein Echvi_2733 [Echinicola vietnamensis DSM 17526]
MQYPGALITLQSVADEKHTYVFHYTYNEVEVYSSLEGAIPATQSMISSYGDFVEFENQSIYLNTTTPSKANRDTFLISNG